MSVSPKVCVIAAHPLEIAPLIRRCQELQKTRLGSSKIYSGIYQGMPLDIAIVGMGEIRARQSVTELLNYKDYPAAIVIGCVGGLSPRLKSGDCFVAGWLQWLGDGQIDSKPKIVTKPNLLDQWVKLLNLPAGGLVTASHLICSSQSKKELFQATQAFGVDLETYHLIEGLKAHNIPWMVLRAVADTHEQTLPPGMQSFIDRDSLFSQVWTTIRLLLQGEGFSLMSINKNVKLCAIRLEAHLRRMPDIFA